MSHPITEAWKAGYRDLVSVVPPDAPISPNSRLKPEARGKVPGIRRGDGYWSGYDFLRTLRPQAADVANWVRAGANIGILGESFPGLDIDVDHPQLAQLVQQEAIKVLGDAPVRLSREPRKLLMYRTSAPFKRVAARIEFQGVNHTVEFLSAGRQYLIYGRHPSGSDYGFAPGAGLADHPAESLQEITGDDALGFLNHLKTLLAGRAEVEIIGDPSMSSENAPPQELLEAPNFDALEALVKEAPNTFPDRESYIAFGHAIKAAGGEEAYPLFAEWAARWTEGTNDPDVVRSDWERMRGPFRVGWSYLTEHSNGISATDEFQADPDATPVEPTVPSITGTLDYTDTWVVGQLVQKVVDHLRYVPETGHWHVWDGHVWATDRKNEADHLIRRALVWLSALVINQAAALSDDEKDRAQKIAYNLQSRNALTKAVPELQAHPALTLCVEDFDQDDWVLNTPTGIVDLRTGRVGDSDPAAQCSKSTKVGPSEAKPVRFLEFLEELTDGDKAMQEYLQKLVGYSLTGSTQEQVLAFVHGPPMTGKTVFLETIAGMFGTYHENTNANTFAKSANDRHPTDLAALAGARLVTASETAEGRGWDTQRVKALTGGDEVSARFMRQDFFTYKPRYQILIVGNHEPEVDGVDAALMRRLHVVPFNKKPENPDRLLFEKLKKEWGSILYWAIQGCRKWLAEGLTPPEVVRERTERYQKEEDPVGLFLEECCDLEDPNGTVSRRRLYQYWAQWCGAQGEDPGTLKQLKRKFAAKQAEHNFLNARVPEGNSMLQGYRGLSLTEDRDPLIDGEL